MDANLKSTTTKYTFAAFICTDEFAIARNGGDAYYRLPKEGAQSDGGSLPFIRGSHSSATDLNGAAGLPFGGLSGSQNSCSSWQYQAIMDMNGDRFPDLVSFPDSSGGSSSFTVVQGTGQGFGNSANFSLPSNYHLAKYDTNSVGFGASLSSSSGGLFVETDSKGKPESISIIKPEAPSGSGVSGSMSVNGGYGSTVQSEGFFDMNGDGLPDCVSRGDGNFSVSLNRGDGTFESPRDWGSGISEQAMPGKPGLTNTTKGISLTGTGSFGVNAGVSAGASGGGASFSVGVSAGYTAQQTRPFRRL